MSERKPSEGDRPTGEKKKGSRQMVLAIGVPILSLICIPFIYYAITINAFAQDN
jgi:hypothetical protein